MRWEPEPQDYVVLNTSILTYDLAVAAGEVAEEGLLGNNGRIWIPRRGKTQCPEAFGIALIKLPEKHVQVKNKNVNSL